MDFGLESDRLIFAHPKSIIFSSKFYKFAEFGKLPTVKNLTFSCGELIKVQMDQGKIKEQKSCKSKNWVFRSSIVNEYHLPQTTTDTTILQNFEC
jgi:hypothetical protein